MPSIRVRKMVDKQALARLGGECAEESARRAAETTARRIKGIIRGMGRVRTGAMVNSIEIERVPTGPTSARFKVGSTLPYYKYQNFGVRPFSAKRGRFLVFRPKGSNRLVFAKRVRGFPGGHFSEKALAMLSVKDFTG